MKTNRDKLVKTSIQGFVDHPKMSGDGYWVGYDGKGRVTPGIGGITYNYFIGDGCMNLAGDHIEPGVSSCNPDPACNTAYNTLACVGNEVRVLGGAADGAKGWVTGIHGGVDHVMLAFDEKTINLLTPNDSFLIKSFGQWLRLEDYPEIVAMNLDPDLLDKMNIQENEDGTLSVPVTHVLPAHLLGAGLGVTTLMQGDYDIMAHDLQARKEYHLDTLRFGDIVMIEDHTCVNGPDYLKGAVTIGVIIHGDSYTAGHGPGVTVLLTSKKSLIKPILDENANIANYLGFKK